MTPMLGCKITEDDLSSLTYPIYAQTKFDGVRCIINGERAVTRTGLMIPNYYIRTVIQRNCDHYMDGEIIIPGLSFNDISGVVRSESSFEERNFQFVLFDWALNRESAYYTRYDMLRKRFEQNLVSKHFILASTNICRDAETVKRLFRINIEKGEEGIILRSPTSCYKYGRSTKNEEYLLKLKYESQSEAVIQAVHEEVAENGDLKGRLGALTVISELYGPFNIGTGFTAKQRQDLWDYKTDLVGMKVQFSFQRAGMKNKPRFPVFQRFV